MIRIYVNYFNNSNIIRNNILTPIQVGRATSKLHLDMIGDDTGDNISIRNSSYCELTGQYWAWKNDNLSDYIGFMHYRRFLNFNLNLNNVDKSIHGILEKSIGNNFATKYGLTENNIEEIMRGYDAVIPEPFDLREIGFDSVEQQYKLTPDHHARDYDIARQAVGEVHPSYSNYFEIMSSSALLYATNIFVFKRFLFDEYCEWLFPLLERIEELVDTSSYSVTERRVIGYLSERLFTVFILCKMDTCPDLRIKKLTRVFVEDTVAKHTAPQLPNTTLKITSIVASTDQHYLPHMGALITSVLSNASKDRFIDFIILDGGLLDHDRRSMESLEQFHPHCRISFIDMSRDFIDIDVNSYFTRSTFYRLALPTILTNRDKVLFLDTDMIVLGDVCELFDISLDGYLIAAVRDLIMKTFCAMGVRSISATGGKPANVYISDHLKMGRRYVDYFQAGTIVFDLKKMRGSLIGEKMVRDLSTQTFWFLDQDVLNKHLVGHVKFIDHCWNTVLIDKNHIDYLSQSDIALYNDSLALPNIVHFAGTQKPWTTQNVQFSTYYWYYLRKTQWYDAVLFGYFSSIYVDRNSIIPAPNNSITRRVLKKMWRLLPKHTKGVLYPIATKIDLLLR